MVVPQLPADFCLRADENRCFIFEPAVQLVFELNATRGRIICLVDGKRTVADIAERLAAEVNAEGYDIPHDVSAFLNGLKNAGMNLTLADVGCL